MPESSLLSFLPLLSFEGFGKTSYEYGKPARKGILNFSNKGDLALLKKILEGSKKRQRRILVLWFNYEWLMTNVKTSTS